jgi:hypothetical protein
MDLLSKNAHGIKMYDITHSTKYIQQWIEGFVEDTSIFKNLEYGDENISLLKQKIEHDGQLWAKFLHISGGALELPKCFFYILSWKWDKWGNPSPQTNQEQQIPNPTLQIDTINDNNKITQKEAETSHKTLGTYKCLFGTEQDHFKHLSTKSDEYATKTLPKVN